MLNGRLPAILG